MEEKSYLQRTHEFFRQYLGFFRQISGAYPVAHAGGIAGLGDETPDFGSKVCLCRIQASSPRRCQISLRDAKTLARLLLRRRRFFDCKFRHNHGRLGLARAIRVAGSILRYARPRRIAVGRRDRRRRRRNHEAEFRPGIRRRFLCSWRRRWQLWPHLHRRAPSERRLSSHGAAAHQKKSSGKQHNDSNPAAGARWCLMETLRPCRVFPHAQAASGSSMRNVVPRPTSEVKSIEPL
jgi:hypothetical protein